MYDQMNQHTESVWSKFYGSSSTALFSCITKKWLKFPRVGEFNGIMLTDFSKALEHTDNQLVTANLNLCSLKMIPWSSSMASFMDENGEKKLTFRLINGVELNMRCLKINFRTPDVKH